MAMNPFKFLRQKAGISQVTLAKLAGVGRSTIFYIETGTYPYLSDYMINILYQQCEDRGIDVYKAIEYEYGVPDVEEAYRIWAWTQRKKAAPKFQTKIDFDDIEARSSVDESPFAIYVRDIGKSKQGFCKLLKVADAVVFRYSKGEAKTMPPAIEEALKEVGCPYIEELKEVQEKWLSYFP